MGAAGVASGMTTPTNIGIMAATEGLGAFAGSAKPIVSKLISAGFSGQMVWNLYNQSKEFKAAMDRGDNGAAAQIAAGLASVKRKPRIRKTGKMY